MTVMKKIIGGKLRDIGLDGESLCKTCTDKERACSFNQTRDMVLCPGYHDEREVRDDE